MPKWEKTGRRVTPECTTIEYSLAGTGFTVESRKEKIPHANRPGSWEHTTYHVLHDGAHLDVRHTLQHAKEIAERLAAE